MSNNENGWYTARLHRVGASTRTGNIYLRPVLERMIENVAKRLGGRTLRGEVCNPDPKDIPTIDVDPKCVNQYISENQQERQFKIASRVLSIYEDQVSHEIDWATACISGDFLVANVRPAGPMAEIARGMIEAGDINFALRGFASFHNGNHVLSLSVVTFDLTSKPL